MWNDLSPEDGALSSPDAAGIYRCRGGKLSPHAGTMRASNRISDLGVEVSTSRGAVSARGLLMYVPGPLEL